MDLIRDRGEKTLFYTVNIFTGEFTGPFDAIDAAEEEKNSDWEGSKQIVELTQRYTSKGNNPRLAARFRLT